jgi:hypothetical protein
MGCMNEEEQEDEILALSEILPPSTLTVERLGPASHSGTLQVSSGSGFFRPLKNQVLPYRVQDPVL